MDSDGRVRALDHLDCDGWCSTYASPPSLEKITEGDEMMRYSEEEKKLIEQTRGRAFQVRDQISIVLQNQGITVDVSHRDYGIGAGINSLDDLSVNLEIKPQYTSMGMTYVNNGKLTLSFGHYGRGRRKNFPEPNAGYNVNKICALLTEWLAREKELDEIDQKRRKQLDWLNEKVKELEPMEKYWVVTLYLPFGS